MKPNKTDGNYRGLQNPPNPIMEIHHTGLYVSCDKSRLLIGVVRHILQEKYSTRAVSGPPLPNGNCEILLQAVHNPLRASNFLDSKGLLEVYLDMLKESRPNFVLEKQPEVINLEEDDDSNVSLDNTGNQSVLTVDDSFDNNRVEKAPLPKSSHIEVIDLSDEETGLLQTSPCEDEVEAVGSSLVPVSNISVETDKSVEQRPASINGDCGDDIMIIDSVPMNNSKFIPLVNNSLSKFSQEFKRGKKRKQSVGIIEIEDDDVVLDDSLHNPKHNSTKSFPSTSQSFIDLAGAGTCSELDLASSSQFSVIDLATSDSESNSYSPQSIGSLLPKSLRSKWDSVVNVTDDQSGSATNGSTSPAKKPSKFSYKRPAHLSSPLTERVLDSACSNQAGSSSSGMSNIYNPNANLLEKRTGLRPIVIDGNNVGVSHGKGQFSVRGVQMCINYFEKRGHRQIKAFIPQYRRKRDCHDALERMERQGTVVITPSRRIKGKIIAPYDDRYIVQYATEVGGVIITSDNYRDLLEENPSWKETIEERILMFSWIEDLLMFPQDPMGRNGSTLNSFLRFPD